MVAIDIAGEKYGRLTAVRHVGRVHCKSKDKYQTKRIWEFRCDCGALIVRKLAHVRCGYVKSCGCGRVGVQPGNTLAYGEASFNGLFMGYRAAARHRQIEWSLTKEQFRILTEGCCSYCGLKPSGQYLTQKTVNGAYTYSGIDRVDNKLGYHPGNVVSCCSLCNRGKHVLSVQEFQAWIERVHEWMK